MTSFVHIEYSKQHPGVERVESAIEAALHLRQGFSGTRGLATLLLSAIAAAVMVAAYQVMDSVAEGHLLVMWMAMWAAAFTALALFASPARQLSRRLMSSLDGWSRSVAEARADQRLWALAKTDPRVMADLETARTRSGSAAPVTDIATSTVLATARRKARVVGAELRAYQRNHS